MPEDPSSESLAVDAEPVSPTLRTAAAAGALGGAFGAGALALLASDLWPFERVPVSLGWGVGVAIGVMIGAFVGRLGGETLEGRQAGKPRWGSAAGFGFVVGCALTPVAIILAIVALYIMYLIG